MQVITTIAELRETLNAHRAAGQSVGFVPTMGALHDGHQSLVLASVPENDITVVSIFVNPLQFAPGEDLEAYPRDLDADVAICDAAGADYVFAPSVAEMYPEPIETTVSLTGVSEPLDGQSRPTHFSGVATVVTKLFSIVGSCSAYFGEKDFQQLAIITKMSLDLSLDVRVVGCPIHRESDGLAMSSRNIYLTPAERAEAVVLNQALSKAVAAIDDGETDPAEVQKIMTDHIATAETGTLDYAEVVDARTLLTPDVLAGELRLLVAVQFGKARLIDNTGYPRSLR